MLQAIRTVGTAVIHGTFSATRFWGDVRRFGCTTTLLVGPMAVFLLRQPPSPEDRDHSLANVILMPSIAEVEEFSERFGVPVGVGYGQSEVAAPLLAAPGEARPGVCGVPRPEFEVALVDDLDRPVPPGEVGECVVRPLEPWSVNRGYYKDPEQSLHAWRNMWWHTGDLLRLGPSGQYEFVDRRKDVLRRRGENISSSEVERHLVDLPAIAEAAVVAVPSEHGEDDIKAVVVLTAGGRLDPAGTLRHLYRAMPYFMVPRYLEVVTELPRTQTMRVQKVALRAAGVTAQVWDCEAHGFRITRAALVEPPDDPPGRLPPNGQVSV